MLSSKSTTHKVILAVDFYPPRAGGMETHAHEFAQYFYNNSVYALVAIFAFSAGNEIKARVKSNIFPLTPELLDEKKDVQDASAFIAACKKHKLAAGDIVFFNSMYWMRLLPELRKALPDVLFIQRSGGNDIVQAPLQDVGKTIAQRRSYICKRINKELDFLIVTSEYSRRRLARLGISSRHMRAIVGGVDLERFTPPSPATKVRCRVKLGLPKDELIILDVSRLVPFKGISYGIDTCRLLSKKYGKHFKYVIVGDGPQRSYLEGYARAAEVENLILWTGEVSVTDMHLYYQAADIFCHTALRSREKVPGGTYIHTESMGRCLIEASASGLPIIATAVGGVAEIILNTQTGILVPSRSAREMADAVAQIRANGALTKRLQRNARKRAEELFAWDTVFSEYVRLFNSLQLS